MENIAHSLVGLAIAEGAVQWRLKKEGTLRHGERAAMWMVSLVANNFPDVDFVLAPLTEGKLGYLLHHRGHTHTLVALPLLAILLVAPFFFAKRIQKDVCSSALLWWLVGLSLVGGVAHIILDSLNSYGVHPFWPFHNGWLYGDAVFIVEPFFWVTLLPFLLLASRRRVVAGSFALLWLAGLALVWFSGMVPRSMVFATTLWGAALFALQRDLAPMRRFVVTASVFVLVLSVFFLASARARSLVTAAHAESGGKTRLDDVILSPSPANPFCFSVLTTERIGASEEYLSRTGLVAPFPSVVPVGDCRAMRPVGGTAAMRAIATEQRSSAVRFSGEYRGSLAELKRANEENCHAAGFFRFARAPFVLRTASLLVLGDLRYDRSPDIDFAEMTAPLRPKSCPRNVPPWLPPRAEWLVAD